MAKLRKEYFETLSPAELEDELNQNGLSVCSQIIRDCNINGRTFLNMDDDLLNEFQCSMKSVYFERLRAFIESINEPDAKSPVARSKLKKAASFSEVLSAKLGTAQNLMIQIKNRYKEVKFGISTVEAKPAIAADAKIYDFKKPVILENESSSDDDIYETVKEDEPECVGFRHRNLPSVPVFANIVKEVGNQDRILRNDTSTDTGIVEITPRSYSMQGVLAELKNINMRFNRDPKKFMEEKRAQTGLCSFVHNSTKRPNENTFINDLPVTQENKGIRKSIESISMIKIGKNNNHELSSDNGVFIGNILNDSLICNAIENQDIAKDDNSALQEDYEVPISIKTEASTSLIKCVKQAEILSNDNQQNDEMVKTPEPILKQFCHSQVIIKNSNLNIKCDSLLRDTSSMDGQEEFLEKSEFQEKPKIKTPKPDIPPPLPTKKHSSTNVKDPKLALIRELQTKTIIYHDVDKDGASKILEKCEVGSFFFRNSRKYFCILMVKGHLQIFNIEVINENGVFYLNTTANLKLFINLKELLNFYILNELHINGIKTWIRLKKLIDIKDYCL